MTDEVSTTRRVGVSETFNAFDTTPTSQKAEYKIGAHQSNPINEVNIVNQSNLLQILSMVLAVRILGLQRKTKTKHADASTIIIPMLEDFDILINASSERCKRI